MPWPYGLQDQLGTDLTKTEHDLLTSYNFGFAALSKTTHRPVEWPDVWEHTWRVSLSSILILLGWFSKYWILSIIFWVLAVAILVMVLVQLGVYALLVVALQRTYGIPRSTCVYWGWWPLFNFIMCSVAALLAYHLGEYIWIYNLQPYYQLGTLQRYDYVDPSVIPSERVQDVGIVSFADGVDIDRGHGGCFVHQGDTFCIAPILQGGQVQYGLDGDKAGQVDFFAVGMNCCRCPNQDFQCGDWKNPLALGGLRSMDQRARPFYALAADDFAAAYGKQFSKALFFEWVQDPVYQWNFKWMQAFNYSVLFIAFVTSLSMTLGLILSKILKVLHMHEHASPHNIPEPPAWMSRIWERVLPRMAKFYVESTSQERQGLPATDYTGIISPMPQRPSMRFGPSPLPNVQAFRPTDQPGFNPAAAPPPQQFPRMPLPGFVRAAPLPPTAGVNPAAVPPQGIPTAVLLPQQLPHTPLPG